MSDANMPETTYARDYLLSKKVYDFIKWVALIALPAFGSFYFALAPMWDLPNAEKVVGTIMIVDTLLGALLGFSARSYNASETKYDGAINVEQVEDGVKRFTLELNGDPNDLDGQKQVVFKVNPS